MTLLELKKAVDRAVEHLHGDPLEVVIQTQNSGVPHRYMSTIVNAQRGFDWTDAYFILHAKDALIVRNEICDVHALAGKRLEALKDVHSKLGFKYIAKSREQEWLDGFVEGVKTQITAVKPCTK